ncbi:DUF7488 domain-containing protein [Sulfurimonas sp.]
MLLRLFIAFNLLILGLYACSDTSTLAIKKIKDSQSIQHHSLWLPVKNNQSIVYTDNIPNAVIIKYDPFLNLYLIKDKHPFAYPFELNTKLHFSTAIVNNISAKKGKFIKNQIGLNSLAKYSTTVGTPAVVLNSCASLEGIVTDRGVVQKAYLERFITSKTSKYSDIGIRVKDEKGFIIVKASDPFMINNPFKRGDSIVGFDNKKIKTASTLMKKILFAKLGSKHTVKVKRNSKFYTYKVVAQQRYGGGYLSDTFLEQKGIYFDTKLRITKLSKRFKSYGLKVGDKLVQVNAAKVNNQKELRLTIENFKDYSSLLFERNNFQFFVNIK